MGIPSAIHEQNAYPGLANRTLEKHVDRVFLGFKDAEKFFKNQRKCVYAGNPVRKSFFTLDRNRARKKLGFKQDDFIVFSFGGSLGAEKINEVAFELMQVLNGHEGASMVFGTGKWYYEQTLEKAAERGIEIKDNIRIKDYIEDMENYLSEEQSLEQSYIKEERKMIVHKALSELAIDYRTILWLVFFEGFSSKEAAITLKKSDRQIKNLLYRAKQSLKSKLEKESFIYEEF